MVFNQTKLKSHSRAFGRLLRNVNCSLTPMRVKWNSVGLWWKAADCWENDGGSRNHNKLPSDGSAAALGGRRTIEPPLGKWYPVVSVQMITARLNPPMQ